VASAYSVRPKPDARVSAPVTWKELQSCDPADFTLKTMPARFARTGDPHEAIDAEPCSLEKLIELSARHERDGEGDAPWPPHYRKQAGEPRRAPPSAGAKKTPAKRASTMPLIEVGRAEKESEVLAGLERWKARHAKAAEHLEPADILVDKMRGRSSLWYRVRVNLQHVPVRQRPKQEALDPDAAPGDPRNGD
jgi:hypothetical protein